MLAPAASNTTNSRRVGEQAPQRIEFMKRQTREGFVTQVMCAQLSTKTVRRGGPTRIGSSFTPVVISVANLMLFVVATPPRCPNLAVTNQRNTINLLCKGKPVFSTNTPPHIDRIVLRNQLASIREGPFFITGFARI
jgi:hypothetical protein